MALAFGISLLLLVLPATTQSQQSTQNSLSLQGYDFTNLTGNTLLNSDLDEIWHLRLDDTVPSDAGLGSQSNLSYSLIFPEGQLPAQNQSTWTLCAHVQTTLFPANISNSSGSSDPGDGDCTPYLGEDCVRNYSQALSVAPFPNPDSDCPTLPRWSDIDACVAKLGTEYTASSQSQCKKPGANDQTVDADLLTRVALMEWLDPGVRVTSNGTYVNRTTGQALEIPPVHGLRSGQIFASLEPNLDPDNVAAEAQGEASQLRLTAFTLKPSLRWVSSHASGFAIQSNANVRLVCGRANAAFNGTSSTGSTLTGPSFKTLLGAFFGTCLALLG